MSIEENKKKNKKAPFGCVIGCLGFIVLVIIGGLVGMFISKDSDEVDKDEIVEGIEVMLKIESNDMFLDEAIVVAEITNTTDKTYSGKVSLFHPSFKAWWIDVENLPPGKKTSQQMKVKYIEHPDDDYQYNVVGELEDKRYSSNISYELFETEVNSSFKIQTEHIDEEIVKKIIREIYFKYGPLTYVGFYDKNQSIEDASPKAQYFGHVDQTITFYPENKESYKIDFNPKE